MNDQRQARIMIFVLLLVFLLGFVFCFTGKSQGRDTTLCLIRIENTKRCTSKLIRGFEVTTRASDSDDLIHVAFLRENKKRIRTRKHRCIYFFESLM